MIILINIFGTFIVLSGIILMIKPSIICDFLSKNSDKIWVYIGAIVVRIILVVCLFIFPVFLNTHK
jgi:hypothetical protein